MKFEELFKDHATIKEAFIIDQLQEYMDLSDPSNPRWINQVRLRLQEKKDWEEKVREAIDKFYYSINKTDTTFENKISDLKQELGLK